MIYLVYRAENAKHEDESGTRYFVVWRAVHSTSVEKEALAFAAKAGLTNVVVVEQPERRARGHRIRRPA